MNQLFFHKPVMVEECVKGLNINPGGVYVDCTFGSGGHSKAILNKLDSSGKIFAFDQDEEAAVNVVQDKRFILLPSNFLYIKNFLKLNGVEKVDGILADLGVSSHQIDTPERGFSIRFDNEKLDMRMDKRQDLSAIDIINSYSKEKLADVFFNYGELTNSRYLSESIVEYRTKHKIETLSTLKKAIERRIKGRERKILTQLFQAIRIEVNQELHVLKNMLIQSKDILKHGGRLVVISFHSLEDRIVKKFMKNEFFECGSVYFNMTTSKPIMASNEELKSNKRSSSAKLRIAERI